MSKNLVAYWLAMLIMLIIALYATFGAHQDTGPVWVIIITNTIWWLPIRNYKIFQGSETMQNLKQERANLYAIFSLSLVTILFLSILAFKFKYMGVSGGLVYSTFALLMVIIIFFRPYYQNKKSIDSKQEIERS